MKEKTVTVEITFKVFEVGDRVMPASSRSVLPPGIWTVSSFHETVIPHETVGTVFVEGRRYGYSAEHLILADEGM